MCNKITRAVIWRVLEETEAMLARAQSRRESAWHPVQEVWPDSRAPEEVQPASSLVN